MSPEESKKVLLHLQRAAGIARRYFITNGFDGALTMLGMMAGFYSRDNVDLNVALSAALGAALRAAAVDQADIGLEELTRNWLGVLDSEVVKAAPEETEVYQGPLGLLHVYAMCEAYHLSNGPSPKEAIAAFQQSFS